MRGEETSSGWDKGEVRFGDVVSSRMFLKAGLIFMQGYIAWVMQFFHNETISLLAI